MISGDYIAIEDLVETIIDNRGKTVPIIDGIGIPLIATNCIKFASIYPVFENIRYIAQGTYDTWFRAHLQPNDILFVNKGTPGRCCITPDPVNFVGAQDMVGLRFRKEYHPFYMLAVIRSKEVQETIQNNHVGLVIAHFRKQELVKLKLPILDKKIRDYIGEVYKNISYKIELNNKINVELEAIAKTLYDYWFVQFDFPDANGKPYKSSGGKMVWNDELKREIPEGWEVHFITKEMDLQYGYPFSTDLFNEDEKGVPVIRIRDILNCTISNYSTEKVDEKYKLNKGDILVGMDGNFHINYWDKDDCYLNQRTLRIRSNKNSISEMQARFSIEPYIKAREKNVSRTTVAHLSAKDVNDLKILKATSEIQNKANEFFKSTLNKIISNSIENQELASLRDWLLPMLMNGQITVGGYEVENSELGMVAEDKVEYKNK